MNKEELKSLDEALDYLNEGKFLNKFKKMFSKKKKSSTSSPKEEPKPMCTEEEYNKFIKKDVDKIYKAYVDATKKAMKNIENSEKYINIEMEPDKDFIIEYGQTFLYGIDIYEYEKVNNMDKYEASEDIGTRFIEELEKSVKENIKNSFEGVSFCGYVEGCDWDDFSSSIEFSRKFFTDRIKKEEN